MAIERKDRVSDTTTTTGTGTVTLTGSAPTGYRSISAAHTDGATVRYAISMGAEWEVGEGVYTASGTTLSRATVLASSNSGSLVDFSAGTKTVVTTLTAQEVNVASGLQQLDYSSDIASAATVDLGTATGNSVTVTHASGTTAITSFGGAATVQKGGIVAVIPSISGGTLTVTHHATNMILLGGANITLASGDVLLMMKNHDSNAEWKQVGGWKADGTAWVVSSSGESGFRNRLINPRGAIYQRTVAATADDAYFADRWYMLTQTGTVTPSALTDPEDGHPTGIRITQAQASAQRFGFAQIIEGKNCKDMRGGSGVLVPRIRASASQAIRYAILGWTGTEDAVTSDVVNDWTSGTYTAGNFFNSTTLSVLGVGSETPSANTWTSLAALTASLGSTFNNIIVLVWTEGTAAQNFTLDFDYVQLEKGSTATTFEARPIGAELALCQRYLPAWNSNGTASPISPAFRPNTITAQANIVYPVQPRVAPTGVSVSNVAHFSYYDTAAWTASNTVFAGGNKHLGIINLTVSSGTAGTGGYVYFNNASGQLLFTGCEL